MSRYQHREFGIWNKTLLRATIADRNLTGQRLRDVLAVVKQPESFNRKCRRITSSHIRKHCRRNRITSVQMMQGFKGMAVYSDSPALVQMRILTNAR